MPKASKFSSHYLMPKVKFESLQGSSQSILPDYVTLKEKLNMHEIQEVQTTLHLCKQLLEAAEACEVSNRTLECTLNLATAFQMTREK